MRASSLLCLCLCSFPVQAQQAATSYRISGVVVDTNGGAPVPHCRLIPSRVVHGRVAGRQFPGGPVTGVDADDHGRFVITLPTAGAWHLLASAPGYTSQAFEEHDGYSSAIVLTEHSPTIDLKFRLAPEASLMGVVLDEAGEAVRNARVGLFSVLPAGPDNQPDASKPRSFTTTDDRGYYEFANLPQGGYRVAVDARPWYASPARARSGDSSPTPGADSLDPSLDVTYPETWYPGVDDPGQAETLMLKPGDSARADLHLLPVAAIHLRVIAPVGPPNAQGRVVTFPPMVERVGSAGSMGFGGTQVMGTSQGQFDISGLAPGLYQIRLSGQDQESRVALVQVSEGGARTVDFTSAATDESKITIRFDGNVEDENAIQVELVNADTGQRVTQIDRFAGDGRPGRGGSRPPDQGPRERIMEVPPGRYEVLLTGRPDVYLTGLAAKSAEVSGRFIKVRGGDVSLTIHVGRGKATVAGIAMVANKPVTGALVMLVPAGLGDPDAITLLTRDQTNTDGSFDLNDVVPGDYILVAIDNGWQINWKDPSTLNRYLVNGIPLSLQPGASVKQNLEAQAP